MAVTDFMQARFLIPNHVTGWYVGCSHWVGHDGRAHPGVCPP